MITKNEISSLNLSPTKKDFVQIWNELIEVASKITERWDPTSTNESDPGIVLLKVLTGIADKLNYNIDKNILEAYMPTAAQTESMRKLCELVGYDIKYYQSAETTARISYTGNTSDKDDDEYLPEQGLAIRKFTTLTNADKDVTFVTTNDSPVLITNIVPWVEVPCIEGQISQCESNNEYNLITLAQLDDNNRYYLPETQIAENGIFVYNAAASDASYTDGTQWEQVSNLNIRASEMRVYKFGFDSFEGRPYLAFPDDVGSLIGDGLFIYFVRTSGLSGNISPNTLEILEVPSGADWENYSAELFEVTNVDATTNGANIESISAAYNNFKKTIGTFDTLVTCRDYMNKIYSLMNAGNLPHVSNALVTDIRNDINNAVTLCSCNEFGILYKETPRVKVEPSVRKPITLEEVDSDSGTGTGTWQLSIDEYSEDEVPLIDHFDLLLYPFKTFTQVSYGTKNLVDPYNSSFTYTEQNNREIIAALDDFKTCAHNLKSPIDGDIVAINNYLRLNALIATSTKVSDLEAEGILKNVKVALVNEFNLRNLDFGEEIPFDSILSVIENADPRIKVVSLQEPTVLTTYSVKEQKNGVASSSEYGIVSMLNGDEIKIANVLYTDDNGKYLKTKKGETAKDIYNKLVLRNILAGRASLFKYDETFVSNNSEKSYTVTKNITSEFKQEELEGIAKNKAPGEYIVRRSDFSEGNTPAPVVQSNSIITLKVFDSDTTPSVYETSKPYADKEVINNVQRIEAVCELSSDSETFENVKLEKNEVIKLRAPNLITTKTFPAYVYYRYEKATNSAETRSDGTASEGRYAECVSLNEFISKVNKDEEKFFTDLFNRAKDGVKEARVKPTDVDGQNLPNLWNDLARQAASAVGIGVLEGSLDEIEKPTSEVSFTKIVYGLSELRTYIDTFFDDTKNEGKGLRLSYYPLVAGTMNIWSDCIRSFEKLPDGATTVLWRLSQTYSYPKGKLVTSAGQRLLAQNGDHLANGGDVGANTYICTDLGEDPKFYSVGDGSDMELSTGDKLYIHYTPSSTNEDGETVNAEPISEVYTSSEEEPVIIKPTGFTLMPTDAVIRQGTSPKKSVDFGDGTGKKDLLALAPNEQIEMRSISRVIFKTPARFYRNFEAVKLDGDPDAPQSYELKDGEYIFYTDQNTQEAAYYGSGSVITLAPSAYIPKATETVEVSDILEQGLHIVPWSNYVLLDDNRTITITEYQYVTLVAGDTLNTLTVAPTETATDTGTETEPTMAAEVVDAETATDATTKKNSYIINGYDWLKCVNTDDKPISYTAANADTTTVLPKIDLKSGSWEVCSFLELSTSPGTTQQLRASGPSNTSNVTVKNTVNIITRDSTGMDSTPIVIEPVETHLPASSAGESDIVKYEPVSVKLSTVAQSATGHFDKADLIKVNEDFKNISLQVKVFKEEAPTLIELPDATGAVNITPISDLPTFPANMRSDNINNYWTKLDIRSWLVGGEAESSDSTIDTSKLRPAALNLNFMIPEYSDLFGIFSIYLSVPDDKLDPNSRQRMLKGPRRVNNVNALGCRVFIDVPNEYGTGTDAITIFNYELKDHNDGNGLHDDWWSEGKDGNRLYLRAGLNCIRVKKSCNLLIRAEEDADGSLLYDNMRLVKGKETHGINLKLLNPYTTFNEKTHTAEEEKTCAKDILTNIAKLDRHNDFYYNVAVENSLAIEFDENINSFASPYTLYDINNINNSFVVSKLDVAYLDKGLKIAKSSRY